MPVIAVIEATVSKILVLIANVVQVFTVTDKLVPILYNWCLLQQQWGLTHILSSQYRAA